MTMQCSLISIDGLFCQTYNGLHCDKLLWKQKMTKQTPFQKFEALAQQLVEGSLNRFFGGTVSLSAVALELAAGPASAPREVVLATKASMRATYAPGSVDADLHYNAMRIELGPQATSIQSPEFQERLRAAQQR